MANRNSARPARSRITRPLAVAGLILAVVVGWSTAASAATALETSRAEQQIDKFLTQYRDALRGTNPNQNPAEVRAEFITAAANQKVTEWGQQHPALDPIFRGKGIPQSWTLTYEGSGLGVSNVKAVQHWGDGVTTSVRYAVSLETLRIVDVNDA